MVRRKIPLGAKVSFTKVGSKRNGPGVHHLRDVAGTWRDRNYANRQVFDPYVQGTTEFVTWEQRGEGIVVGLTHRQNGRQDWEEGLFCYLQETAPRVACYQVKKTLGQVKPFLVPEDSIEWIDNDREFRFPVERDE